MSANPVPQPEPDEREVKLKKLIRETLEEVAKERDEAKKKNQKHWTESIFG